MRHHHRPTARAGFTIVELLVAMALIILIMTIISAAFSVSMNTFRDLKAIGDMQEQLRSASAILRTDLAAHHFETEAGDSPRLHRLPTNSAWDGSKKGFFYIRQDSALTTTSPTYEGQDADGIPSWRATDQEFGMTVKLSGKTQSDTASGMTTPLVLNNMGGNNLVDFASNSQQMVSQWAEVYYFLRPTSVVTSEANGGTLTLYTLYRRMRVLSPNTVLLPNTGPNAVQYNPDVLNSSSLALAQVPLPPMPVQPPQFMAVGPEALNTFVTPAPPGVFLPANRLGGWYDPHRPTRPGYPASPPPHTGQIPIDFATEWRPYQIPGTDSANRGTDVVLNNVLSFRIQIQDATGAYVDLPASLGGTGGAFPRIYDTARPAPVNGKPQIRGIKIQVRVYHANTSMARQATVIQDM